MNALTKLQLWLACFLVLVLFGLMLDLIFLVPAAGAFLVQLRLRKILRTAYPEDWKRYMTLFLIYEAIVAGLLAAIYAVLSGGPVMSMQRGFDISRLYTIFVLVLVVLFATAAMQFLFRRRYCFGTVLFTTKGWAGVEIMGDFFSRVVEGDYAVRNPRGLPLRKGDRVKVGVKKTYFSKPKPDVVQGKVDVRGGFKLR